MLGCPTMYVNTGRVKSNQVRAGQVRSDESSELGQSSQSGQSGQFDNARLGHPFSLVLGARSTENKIDNARLGHPFSLASRARSAEKILTTLDWLSRFLWYLARAAQREF